MIRPRRFLGLVVCLVPFATTPVQAGTLDSDGDGLSDSDELAIHRTDPFDSDTDDDGLDDGVEISLRSEIGFSGYGPSRVVRVDSRSAAVGTPADLDGDGDVDVVVGWNDADELVWQENTTGRGDFDVEHVIDPIVGAPKEVVAGDLDGDGDLDLVLATELDTRVAWYENLDGAGTFGPARVVAGDLETPRRLDVVDLDGDGDLDLVVPLLDGDRIVWFANLDGVGGYGPARPVAADINGPRSARGVDLDGDGDRDVLAQALFGDEIVWYPNLDGAGTFGPANPIDGSLNGAYHAIAADLDGDGDLDVASASLNANEIAWHENVDGLGTFAPRRTLGSSGGVVDVEAADVDGDGDLDLGFVAFFSDEIGWFENRDGQGDFGPQETLADAPGAPVALTFADADRDLDPDLFVVWSSRGEVGWFPNRNGTDPLDPDSDDDGLLDGVEFLERGTHPLRPDSDDDGLTDGAEVLLHGTDPNRSDSDDDGVEDPVEVRSFGGFAPERPLPDSLGARALAVGDLDGDGDPDVVSTLGDLLLLRHRNLDGKGTFALAEAVEPAWPGVESLAMVDADGDGDVDVAAASSSGGLAWFENAGDGEFVARHAVEGTGCRRVRAGDLDGDGDSDLLVARGDEIVWFENRAAGFSGSRVVAAALAGAIDAYAIDLDGDGDLDVAAAGFEAETEAVVWIENVDGRGTFALPLALAGEWQGTVAVAGADFDLDGAADLVTAERTSGRIDWSRNLDGRGSFGPRLFVDNAAFDVVAIAIADVDGDGDPDVLSARAGAGELQWHESREVAGDRVFATAQPIASGLFAVEALAAADLDGDGRPDVLAPGSGSLVSWRKSLGGLAALDPDTDHDGLDDGAELALGTDPLARDSDGDGLDDGREVEALGSDPLRADTDGDGRSDLIDVHPPFVRQPIADAALGCALAAGDLDSDGDVDLLASTGAAGLVVLENRALGFEPPVLLTNLPTTVDALRAIDLDDDGDLDIVAASYGGGRVDWLEDVGDSLAPPQAIAQGLVGFSAIAIGDLDRDGDRDVLVAADGRILRYTRVAGSFTPGQVVAETSPVTDLSTADLDGDGDRDVVIVGTAEADVGWLENRGVDFAPLRVISRSAPAARRIAPADLDDDGDVDLVVASDRDGELAWLENLGAGVGFGSESVVAASRAGWLDVADVDLDGVQDLLASLDAGRSLVWYEGLEGDLPFSRPRVVAQREPGWCAVVQADLDGDGDLDFAAVAGDEITAHWNPVRAVPEPLGQTGAALAVLLVLGARRRRRARAYRARADDSM